MLSSLGVFETICCFVALLLLKRLVTTKSREPLPPGPKGLPLIGNLFDIPRAYEWLTFTEWAKRWGSVVSAQFLGKTIVILSSYEDAVELLERRGSVYSDRPTAITATNIGMSETLGLRHYDDTFRAFRRLTNKMLGDGDTRAHVDSVVTDETRKFLRRIFSDPDNLPEQIRRTAGAVILMTIYGYPVQENDDPLVNIADRALTNFALTTTPGTFMVDMIPALQYLPRWFPGMRGYWKTVDSWSKDSVLLVEAPYEFTCRQRDEGTMTPCFVSKQLQAPMNDMEEYILKWAASSLYGGGADTTVSANYSFFLAMVLNPLVQARAQQEIDAVVGTDRLPTIADRKNLPYIGALVKEVLRWNPVTPLAVPHSIIRNDIYKGYLIPKGSTVIANVWYLLHDPQVYRDPLSFDPTRFLGDQPERDPRLIAFGFGRRLCPGVSLADTSMFLLCALTLAVFDIKKLVRDGRVVEPTYEYGTGTISHPKPFECSIKPRSAKAQELIFAE